MWAPCFGPRGAHTVLYMKSTQSSSVIILMFSSCVHLELVDGFERLGAVGQSLLQVFSVGDAELRQTREHLVCLISFKLCVWTNLSRMRVCSRKHTLFLLNTPTHYARRCQRKLPVVAAPQTVRQKHHTERFRFIHKLFFLHWLVVHAKLYMCHSFVFVFLNVHCSFIIYKW